MMEPLKISLVMPVRNEETSVASTVDSVFASTRLPDEIVVADGLSTDRTVERIHAYAGRHIPIHVLPNPTYFSGGGRNIAIRHAIGDVILLADFGNIFDPRWIEEMARPFEESRDVLIVTGLHRPLVTTDFEHCMAAIHYHIQCLLDTYPREERKRFAPKIIVPGGASLGLRRGVWERVGGYPEWLPKAQDKLFSRKCYALGIPVQVSWDAFVSHHIRSSPSQVFKQLVAHGRGNGRSRCIDSQFFKLAMVYGSIAILALLSVASLKAAVLAVLLIAAYLYRAGLRKIVKVDGGLTPKYVWLVPLVLIPRDVGLMVGHVWGWLEWICVRKYRTLYRAYLAGCDAERLKATSR